ncbi:MAG: hypothetical protein ACRC9P_00315, partial [Bacteroides sp.]
MKVNELRIGNWVMGYNDPFKWSLEHFDLLKQADLDEIIKAPIPLTEEVLLKCGFRKVPKALYIDDFSELRAATTYKKGFIIWNADTIKFWVGNSVIDNIKHLHELQNLYFAITGEE